MATDGSMISGRVDDVIKNEDNENDLVAVSEGGQCIKCMGFFSIMILLPALVFMFIHLGNNDWKFKVSEEEVKEPTYEDIDIPSVSLCEGDILFGQSVSDVFDDNFKKNEYIDDVL